MAETDVKNYITKLNINKDNIGELYIRDQEAQEHLDNIKIEILKTSWPIGSIFWTEKSGSINEIFEVNDEYIDWEWKQITDVFIYATKNEIPSEHKITSQIKHFGNSTVLLNVDNLPKHTHRVIEPNGGRGHFHKIRTFGDDYNAGHVIGQLPNFALDGNRDMTEQNFKYDVYADYATTGITIQKNESKEKEIEIMPPYICRYCWQRIK